MLNRTNTGYEIKTDKEKYIVSHLLYMDDLNMYDNKINRISKYHRIIISQSLLSKDINMKFRLNKCRTLNIPNKKVSLFGYETICQYTIRPMDVMETYKYLKFLPSKRIEHTEIRIILIFHPAEYMVNYIVW